MTRADVICSVLLDAFNDDQSDRYAAYKRLKLQLPVLKRIANQTLSQSIPPQVAISLAGLTKVFAGEIVEKARDVQDQWIRAERGLKPGDKLDDDSKGPLLPDHLREAVRLYKKDQEGGGVGFRGLSLNAKENYAGGRVRRLFK
jgi:transcription initiation factor TFIID subunit 11